MLCLTFTTLGKFSREQIDNTFLQKTGFEISCNWRQLAWNGMSNLILFLFLFFFFFFFFFFFDNINISNVVC